MSKPLVFPIKPESSQADLEREFVRVNHTLASDKLYHFSLAVTRSWRVVNVSTELPEASGPLSTVGLFRRVSEPIADIEVAAVLIPREVNPADWLEVYLARAGHQILAARRLPSSFGEAGDYLSTLAVDGSSYAARSMAIKDSNRLFVVQARVAQDEYGVVAEEFLLAVQTFQLLEPTKEVFAEAVRSQEITLPIDAGFLFPASWQFKQDPVPLPGGSSFCLLNLRNEQWVGQFTFAAIPSDAEVSHQELADGYFQELRSNGIELCGAELSEREHEDQYEGCWGNVVFGTLREQQIEIRCCVLKHVAGWFLFGLVGPTRDQDADAQIVNARAFSLSLETFRIGREERIR